jgi:hypothetical protein
MSCAINPVLMAHQWRNPFCAVIKFALVKTNGALVCAVWYFQWRANSANGAKRDKFFGDAAASPAVAATGRFTPRVPALSRVFFLGNNLAANSIQKRNSTLRRISQFLGLQISDQALSRRPQKEAKNGPFYGPIFAYNERIYNPLFIQKVPISLGFSCRVASMLRVC